MMIPLGLASNLLWASLALLLASALSGRRALAGIGWILFGAYWLGEPGYYLGIEDYFNAALTVGVALFSIYMAWIFLAKGGSPACAWASRAVSICGLVYFPFAQSEPLQSWLIGNAASMTAWLLGILSVPVSLEGGNVLVLNGRSVEIILACTAIESIALFVGVILSVRAPLGRKLGALALSTLAIYSLNAVRNAFVLLAYGEGWFGEESFFVAHNVVAKIGSTLALLVIAYFVLSVLPELLIILDELVMEIKHPGRDAA